MNIFKVVLSFLLSLFKSNQPYSIPVQQVSPQMIDPVKPNILLDTAKKCLTQRITLDNSVPAELGCAEAVSVVLVRAGIGDIPKKGFAGTSGLNSWLKTSRLFVKIQSYELGAVIIAVTGECTYSGAVHGHVGICSDNNIILSNNSNTGLFDGHLTLDIFMKKYHDELKFPIHFYKYDI